MILNERSFSKAAFSGGP